MSKTKEKPTPIPTTPGAAADLLYRTRQKRLEIEKKVNELKEQEKALRDYLLENLPEHGAEGIAGKLCRVNIVTKEIPIVSGDDGWDRVGEFIKKNWKTVGLSLVQKRLNQGAVKEIIASGKTIPGVEIMKQKDLSVTKR